MHIFFLCSLRSTLLLSISDYISLSLSDTPLLSPLLSLFLSIFLKFSSPNSLISLFLFFHSHDLLPLTYLFHTQTPEYIQQYKEHPWLEFLWDVTLSHFLSFFISCHPSVPPFLSISPDNTPRTLTVHARTFFLLLPPVCNRISC